jgi:hypothetical protein
MAASQAMHKSRSERLTDRSHQSGSAGVLARGSRMRVGRAGEGLGKWADNGDLAQAALFSIPNFNLNSNFKFKPYAKFILELYCEIKKYQFWKYINFLYILYTLFFFSPLFPQIFISLLLYFYSYYYCIKCTNKTSI